MSPPSSIAKAIFVFFTSLPYAIFRVGYFVFTLPRRLRRIRTYHELPKSIVYERLSRERMSILQMVEHIHQLRLRHGQKDFQETPSMFHLIEELWNEEMTSGWKIPTVREVLCVRNDLLANLHAARVVASMYHVWAIAEDSHTFVALDLVSGEYEHAVPNNALTLLRGKVPDSREQCFAYAVSVAPIHNVEIIQK